jgi:phosphate uptake regulator
MSQVSDQNKILAFAVFELRLLLAGHLSPDAGSEPSVRAAALLAYALHNQALAVLDGKSFDAAQAVESIANVDRLCGENFVQQLTEAMNRAA